MVKSCNPGIIYSINCKKLELIVSRHPSKISNRTSKQEARLDLRDDCDTLRILDQFEGNFLVLLDVLRVDKPSQNGKHRVNSKSKSELLITAVASSIKNTVVEKIQR